MNLETLRLLQAKGLSLDDIIEVAAAMERKSDPTNADRQARYREKRKANKENVTRYRNGVTPPNDSILTPGVSSSDDEENTKPRRKRGPVCVRPDDIPEQLWSDWQAHRAKHRADAGQTTLDAYRREADRVGWTLEQALTEQISRGWRGFKAKWVQDDGRPAQPAKPFGSLRGSRPNPALDMVLQAERELQAEAFREDQGFDWPSGPALPSC